MHYIINPWIFYILYLADSTKVVCVFFLILFVFGIVAEFARVMNIDKNHARYYVEKFDKEIANG